MKKKIEQFLNLAGSVLLDKKTEINLLLAGLLAEGHILIEDVPGVGKTTLIKTVAQLTQLKSSRIQMTNDLLPGDLIGSSIFDPDKKSFVFYPGPMFSQIVLIDELNRATPKSQSACLQAMEERKVTVDGKTHSMENPFFVIATQNPNQQVGTFPLPESQLDRFLMRIQLGYPSREAEKQMLLGEKRSILIENLAPVFNASEILQMQKEVRGIQVSEALIEYVQNLVQKSRESQTTMTGLSPRAATHWVQAARAWAYLQGRPMVIPEDVQAVGLSVIGHRLNSKSDWAGHSGQILAQEILQTVSVP